MNKTELAFVLCCELYVVFALSPTTKTAAAYKYSTQHFLVVGGPKTQFTKFMFVYSDLGFGGARKLVAVCALF